MRGFLASSIAGLAFATALGSTPLAATPKPGEEPPSFRLEDLDGRTVSLDQFAGKVVSIHFFATWCEPCLAEMPEIEKAASRYRGRDYQPLLIAVAHRQDVRRLREFVQAKGIEVPVLYDSRASVQQLYGVTGLPLNVIVGRDGKIRHASNVLPSPFFDEIGRLLGERSP